MTPSGIVIVQTAFPGDVVLTLPLARRVKELNPGARVGFVVTPGAADLLANHPAIDDIILFDKRGSAQGLRGLRGLARRLRTSGYDVALVPHRSVRSALLVRLAGIPRRIGFDRSAGRIFFTDVVRYDPDQHEVDRNLALLSRFGPPPEHPMVPELYPSSADMAEVDRRLRGWTLRGGSMIAVAPGSVWATKRWPAERFAGVVSGLIDRGWRIVLVGGTTDRELCSGIEKEVRSAACLNTAGELTLLQSAELIRRCELLISNDSAPVHLASAMRTPVIALFGPTIPAFGFAPRGPSDVILDVSGLDCRPCGIHGGTTCPTGTFACMLSISPARVLRQVELLCHGTHDQG
jgi:heptosyltransferase II